MESKDLVLNNNPQISAYLTPDKEMFKVLSFVNAKIKNGEDVFISNNKCWFYAFNFTLIRRFQAIKPRLKRKDIERFAKDNEEFLKQVNEITHEIKN